MSDEQRPRFPHFHITGSTWMDGAVLVDGQPFPWDIRAVSWRFDNDSPFPELTFTVSAGRITIDHTDPQHPQPEATE